MELLFAVYASGRELEVRAQMPRTMRLLDAGCAYVYCEGDVLHLPPSQREIVRVLMQAGSDAQADDQESDAGSTSDESQAE